MSLLQPHPFAMEAYFKRSIVLTFAFEKEKLKDFIPSALELDVFDDKWAFVAVALVETKGMRPKGFPSFLGRNFFLVGYRIFVKYHTNSGKRLRGLYILKSQTDQRSMEILGNWMTNYKYETIDVSFSKVENGEERIDSKSGGISIALNTMITNPSMPVGSVFAEWADARRYSGPLPFTFSVNKEKGEVIIVEGVRSNWKPRPIGIENYHIDFFNKMNLKDEKLSSAFIVENIPYYWKKGRVENITSKMHKHEEGQV